MRMTLMSGTENPRPGVAIALSGEPYLAALAEATLYDYRKNVRQPLPADALRTLEGHRVTVTLTGKTMLGSTSIQAVDGRVFLSGSGESVGLLEKGKRTQGIRITPDNVLDYVLGYNGHEMLRSRLDAVTATYPKVEKLTREHLLTLPDEAPDPAQIGLVVFGTWRTPGDVSPGAIWSLHSYIREDDIAEGCLIVRPEHGTSEYGSVYGRDLLRVGGRVVTPPAMSFREALELGDLPYAQALARFGSAGA